MKTLRDQINDRCRDRCCGRSGFGSGRGGFGSGRGGFGNSSSGIGSGRIDFGKEGGNRDNDIIGSCPLSREGAERSILFVHKGPDLVNHFVSVVIGEVDHLVDSFPDRRPGEGAEAIDVDAAIGPWVEVHALAMRTIPVAWDFSEAAELSVAGFVLQGRARGATLLGGRGRGEIDSSVGAAFAG